MADEKKEGAPATGDGGGPKTKGYKLKPGKRHFHNGRAVEDGETIQLTETQYKAFQDKFESDEDVKRRKEIEEGKKKGVPPTPAATSKFPQDKGAARRDPAGDLNPGNAVPVGPVPAGGPAPPPAPEK